MTDDRVPADTETGRSRVRLGLRWWTVENVHETTGRWPDYTPKTIVTFSRGGRIKTKEYPGHCAVAFGGSDDR